MDEAAWPAPSPTAPHDPDPNALTPFSAEIDGGRMDVENVLGPMIDKFKKKHGLK